MNFRKMLVSESKYNLKCPHSMSPIGIIVHNTANDASANNEVSYMINNSSSTSFHYAVDDIEVVQGLPLDRNSWNAGDGGSGNGNRKYLSIEICYSKSGGDKFIQAERNCAKFVAKLLKDYGWGINNVKKHQDFSGKYCPHRTLDMGWNRFLDMVDAEVNNVATPPLTTDNLYRVRASWQDVKSQQGAYKDLNNAKAQADKTKLNVYDKDGNLVYSANSQPTIPTPPPTPQPTPKTVTYQVHTVNGVWYPNVVNLSDYAGVFGKAIDCVYASANVDIKTRVHIKGGNWLPWVSQRNDYAGIYGKTIDGIQIDSTHKVKYRVYVGGRWLPFVQNVTDYAGIYGQNIEGLQIVFEG